MDNKEWFVEENNGKYYVISNLFIHDVWLEISGDFSSPEEKHEYTQKICDILNAHGPVL